MINGVYLVVGSRSHSTLTNHATGNSCHACPMRELPKWGAPLVPNYTRLISTRAPVANIAARVGKKRYTGMSKSHTVRLTKRRAA